MTVTHQGWVNTHGYSLYQFTTGSTAGSYVISLNNTQSDLSWTLYSDSGFTSSIADCNNYQTPGAYNESCPVTLNAGTNYYLYVTEWDWIAGKYLLRVAPP
jgi:hypothetical protein